MFVQKNAKRYYFEVFHSTGTKAKVRAKLAQQLNLLSLQIALNNKMSLSQ